MRDRTLLYAIGLSLALGGADPLAAEATRGSAVIQADHNSGDAVRDLGLAPPADNSSDPAPSPALIVNSAEPVPELPTWAMMLLCLIGLGLAGFKKGRKDRLSPGIE
jgi:hypothetical protein